MSYKDIGKITFLIVIMGLVIAQEADITIRKKGYGETPQEVHFTIHNTGDVDITNVKISLDGNLAKIIQGKSAPNSGFEVTLLLEPGEHLIEVETPEGAYDSLQLTVSSVKPDIVDSQGPIPFTKTNNFRVLLIFGILSLVIIWIITKKPKLE